jgi:hypothetical protein
MANTRRESTASYRSEDIADSAGSTLIPALGSGPHLSTAIAAICQEATSVPLPIREPMISRVADATDLAFALHTRTIGSTGSTVSVIDGNMAGRKLYAVCINPERTIELEYPPSWRQLFAYALTNVDVLLKPGRALGTWVNPKGRHVLDIVVCCPDRAVAIALGQSARQFSIFSLFAGREIQIERACPLLRGNSGGRNA